MASGKKKSGASSAGAAVAASSPCSRSSASASTTMTTTPPPPSSSANANGNGNNNNYAAPHTPIASAKRPRDQRRQSRSSFGGGRAGVSRLTPRSLNGGKRSSSFQSSSSASPSNDNDGFQNGVVGATDGKENHNGANNDAEGRDEERCSRAAGSGASANAGAPAPAAAAAPSASPMSPMHPARPMTDGHHHHHHHRSQRSRDNGGAVGVVVAAGEEEEGGVGGSTSASTDPGGHERTRSWVGSKVDAIFSPVLNFLHGPATTSGGRDGRGGGEGDEGHDVDDDGDDVEPLEFCDCDSRRSSLAASAERKATEETVDAALDEDGDVSMADAAAAHGEQERDDDRRRHPSAVYEGHVRSTRTTTSTLTTTAHGNATVAATTTTDTTVIRKSSDASAASASSSHQAGRREAEDAESAGLARLAVDRRLQEDPDVERSYDSDDLEDDAYRRRGHYPTQQRQQQQHQHQHHHQHLEESSSEEEEDVDIEDQDALEEDEDEDDEDDEEEEEFNPYLFIKSLPHYSLVVPHPSSKICLPPKHPRSPPISLVLDLDETLVHCTVEPTPDADMVFPVTFNDVEYRVHVRTRPYLKEFLEMVKDKFEVVVFTASQRVYADELLDRIDPGKKYIKHRMFRESCLPVEGNYLKDLNVLGRDLSKSVLVDNSPHAFGYQVDNGIPIESWFDDPNDTELLKLERFLRTLHDVDDVRDAVRNKFQTFRLIMEA